MTQRERKYFRRRKIDKLEARRKAILLCMERFNRAIELSGIAIQSAQQAMHTFGERVAICFADHTLN